MLPQVDRSGRCQIKVILEINKFSKKVFTFCVKWYIIIVHKENLRVQEYKERLRL